MICVKNPIYAPCDNNMSQSLQEHLSLHFFQMSRHCCTYYSARPSDQHVRGLCEDIMWMGTTLLRNFRIENKQLSVYLAAVRGFDGYSPLFPVKTHS